MQLNENSKPIERQVDNSGEGVSIEINLKNCSPESIVQAIQKAFKDYLPNREEKTGEDLTEEKLKAMLDEINPDLVGFSPMLLNKAIEDAVKEHSAKFHAGNDNFDGIDYGGESAEYSESQEIERDRNQSMLDAENAVKGASNQ